jgi:hypothetical protein
MADLLLPLPVRVSKASVASTSNTATSPSIFSGAQRSLARSGDYWAWDVSVSAASDRESFPMRAALRRLRLALRGQANRLWFADPSYQLRGSFPTGELVPNGLFAYGSGTWSTSGAALSVADGYARIQNSGAAAGYAVSAAAIPIVSGASYAVRALTYPGKVAAWAVNCGATSGASGQLASGAITAQGLYYATFTAAGASTFLSLLCNTSTSADFVHYLFASISRCALVNGASQTGANLNIQGLPTSSAGLLLPGDRVQIGTQLNTVDAPLNSDGSGLGYLQCTHPWRVSPANGAPIIISNPMARCMLTSNSGGWDESPGKTADFEFQIQESLDLNQ